MKTIYQRSIYDAAELRWLQGRLRFGLQWKGKHPLVELYEELLDALNYSMLAENSGMKADGFRESLYDMLCILQVQLKTDGLPEWNGDLSVMDDDRD